MFFCVVRRCCFSRLYFPDALPNIMYPMRRLSLDEIVNKDTRYSMHTLAENIYNLKECLMNGVSIEWRKRRHSIQERQRMTATG